MSVKLSVLPFYNFFSLKKYYLVFILFLIFKNLYGEHGKIKFYFFQFYCFLYTILKIEKNIKAK